MQNAEKKKKYSKPYMHIESFQLDAALAAGCNVTQADASCFGDQETVYFAADACGWDVPFTDVDSCTGDNTLCYHGLTPELTVQTS